MPSNFFISYQRDHMHKVLVCVQDHDFILNTDKFNLVPAKRNKFLGFILDSSILILYPPPEKVLIISSVVKTVIKMQVQTLQFLIRVLVLLFSITEVVLWATIHEKCTSGNASIAERLLKAILGSNNYLQH